SSFGCSCTKVNAGNSIECFPNPSLRLFSSGTQSKHHAKFGGSFGKSKWLRIHSPPHGPGSKKGTTRNGRSHVFCNPKRYKVPETIRGSPGRFVSRKKSIFSNIACRIRSATRQSIK